MVAKGLLSDTGQEIQEQYWSIAGRLTGSDYFPWRIPATQTEVKGQSQ
jgi:hypothetical protein